ADRKAGLDGRLVDRPVASPPERLAGAAEHEHLAELAPAGTAPDLARGRHAVLVGHADRRAEPRLAANPELGLRLVRGRRHGGGKIGVLLAEPGRRERGQDGVVDPIEIEMLLADEVDIAPGHTAGRPGIAARRQRGDLRELIALGMPVPLADAVGVQILPPAVAQMRLELLVRDPGVEVAVDDLDLGLLRPQRGLELHVHGRRSLTTIYAVRSDSDSPSAVPLTP